MAAMNSSVLACSYAVSGIGASELTSKYAAVSMSGSPSLQKLPVIKAQQSSNKDQIAGRRVALLGLAAALFAAASSNSSANAGVIDDYLEKSKANKELNDKKRLATSGANFARAYTVQFGTCKFPENFTGCQDLAKQKKVPFLSDDLDLECEGKDKYKCGSNVFWKWFKVQANVDLSNEEGTLWWHAHSEWDRAMVHGAIVVYPKLGTYSYPFPRPAAELTLVLDTFKLEVEYGKTYLLRMINSAMNEILFFAVAEHKLTVVGTDGSYTKPLTRDFITISPGLTYDRILEANQKPDRSSLMVRDYQRV
ncbi:Photosystem I reaction center subunit N, chloroplastic [Capsicum chinense]|nr:Photosystem I reaction center subunit N, chloroplastic [Capsicum chinense]